MVLYFELVHSISMSSHVTTSYAEKIELSSMLNTSSYSTSESSTNSSKRSTESTILIFSPCFTVCIFARNLESDGLGRVVQPTGKYLSIRHMEYPKFQTGIFGPMESAHGVLLFINYMTYNVYDDDDDDDDDDEHHHHHTSFIIATKLVDRIIYQ